MPVVVSFRGVVGAVGGGAVVVGGTGVATSWWRAAFGRGLAGLLELLLAEQLLLVCEAGLRLSGEKRLVLRLLDTERRDLRLDRAE